MARARSAIDLSTGRPVDLSTDRAANRCCGATGDRSRPGTLPYGMDKPDADCKKPTWILPANFLPTPSSVLSSCSSFRRWGSCCTVASVVGCASAGSSGTATDVTGRGIDLSPHPTIAADISCRRHTICEGEGGGRTADTMFDRSDCRHGDRRWIRPARAEAGQRLRRHRRPMSGWPESYAKGPPLPCHSVRAGIDQGAWIARWVR